MWAILTGGDFSANFIDSRDAIRTWVRIKGRDGAVEAEYIKSVKCLDAHLHPPVHPAHPTLRNVTDYLTALIHFISSGILIQAPPK